MSAAVSVALRELAERRVVIWAAIAAGFLPLLSPVLPGIHSAQGPEARDIMCLILASAFCVGASVLVGAGVVARDLSEGRLGFDFSRPISGFSIWAGRFGGAIAVVALAVLVVMAPTAIATSVQPGLAGVNLFSVGAVAASFVAAILCLLPIAHAASIAYRSRTRWLALDLVAIVVTALGVATLGRLLTAQWALQVAFWLGVALSLVALAALWIASAVQVAAGRTDIRRGHFLQSVTLWSIVLCALALAGGYVAWLLRAGPHDLAAIHGVSVSSGPWVYVVGPGRGRGDYNPALLVHSRDGRVVRLGGVPWGGDIAFSEDGRRAVWIHMERFDQQLWVTDLDASEPAPKRSPVVLPSRWVRHEVSPDGRRIAVLDGAVLAVHDLDTGAVTASVRINREIAPGAFSILRFRDNGTLRVYFNSPHIEVYELDIAARSLVRTGNAEDLVDCVSRSFSRDGERLVISRPRTKEALLLDARSAAVLAVLPPLSTGARAIAFLQDGRLVTGERRDGRSLVRVLSRDGVEERALELDAPDLISFGGEPEAGTLIATFGTRSATGAKLESLRCALLDLNSGTLRTIAADRAPAVSQMWFEEIPPPGSEGNELFLAGPALVRIDRNTGKETVVAGRIES